MTESAKDEALRKPNCPWCGRCNWEEDQFNPHDAPHKAYGIVCDTKNCGFQTGTYRTAAEAWDSIQADKAAPVEQEPVFWMDPHTFQNRGACRTVITGISLSTARDNFVGLTQPLYDHPAPDADLRAELAEVKAALQAYEDEDKCDRQFCRDTQRAERAEAERDSLRALLAEARYWLSDEDVPVVLKKLKDRIDAAIASWPPRPLP